MRRIILLNLSIIVIIGLLAIFLVNADSNVDTQAQPAQQGNPCKASTTLQEIGSVVTKQCALNGNQEFDVSPYDPVVEEACEFEEVGHSLLHSSGEAACRNFCHKLGPSCEGKISEDANNKYTVTCGLDGLYQELEDGKIGENGISPVQSAFCVKTFKCECS